MTSTSDKERVRRKVMEQVAEGKREMFREATGGRINMTHEQALKTVRDNVVKAERQNGGG